jgi:hypothetical protein
VPSGSGPTKLIIAAAMGHEVVVLAGASVVMLVFPWSLGLRWSAVGQCM